MKTKTGMVKYVAGGVAKGIKFEGEDVWYNPANNEVKNSYDDGIVGTEVCITLDEKYPAKFTKIESPDKNVSTDELPGIPTTNKSSDNPNAGDAVVQVHGKDHVTYKALLKQAHEKGLDRIIILKEWVSEDMKRAWCIVRAEFVVADTSIPSTGGAVANKRVTFDGFGSSTPENTGNMTKEHPVEMAHTRAKGRALRDFLNIGTAMIEELKKGVE